MSELIETTFSEPSLEELPDVAGNVIKHIMSGGEGTTCTDDFVAADMLFDLDDKNTTKTVVL